jgi:adenylate cyclase
VASTRRLAAIMFTDMVGYTASTQASEARTLELLDDLEGLVRPLLTHHHGREIKSTGDGFLVEFDSALMATRCAIDIQRAIHERNDQPGVTPFQIRIGVHLGDVEQRGTDIVGDAVNIAARIEPVAEPGGICVSGAVREQVWNKIPDELEKLAPKALKGLQISTDIYRVVPPSAARNLPDQSTGPTGIAVLPFSNISPDPKDEYFADGLTEELITVLSQLKELRVISRTSVMQFKATTKSVSQIGTELGVVSILEGSVRKSGNRLRVAAQLIDARSDRHLWAQTYDRELHDVFAVQAEIARQVAEALKIELLAPEAARLDGRALPHPESYLEYLQGRTSLHTVSEEALRSAQAHFERALELDERNAAAHAGLADIQRVLGSVFHHLPKAEWEATSRGHAARAIELDPNLAEAHASLGFILWDDAEYPAAEREIQRALALNPSFAWARIWYADLLADEARSEEALREFALAEELDPLSTLALGEEIQLLVLLRRLDAAEVKIEKLGQLENFGLLYHNTRVNLCFARGDLGECLREIDQVTKLLPGHSDLAVGYAAHAAWSGEEQRARELLRTVESLPEPVRPDGQIAGVYANLGDLDACFHWLEIAVRTKRIAPRFWRLEPTLSHVRNDPRFAVLLRELNLS